MRYRKTPVAARELGVRYHTLYYLVKSGAIAPPEKDSSDDYVWSDADLERARQALAARRKRKAKPAA